LKFDTIEDLLSISKILFQNSILGPTFPIHVNNHDGECKIWTENGEIRRPEPLARLAYLSAKLRKQEYVCIRVKWS